MSYDDFHGATFAVGTVTGTRAFSISGGALMSPIQYYHWQPGENVAECALTASKYIGHRAGSEKHGCGFYAYYDGSNDQLMGNRVAGIIEGYGQITYGPRGFRAEKAKVVGLIRYGVPTKGTIRVPMLLMAYWTIFGLMWLVTGNMFGFFLDLGMGVISVLVFGTILGGWGSWGAFRHRHDLQAIADEYGVPLYRTPKAAFKAHPLSAPEQLP